MLLRNYRIILKISLLLATMTIVPMAHGSELYTCIPKKDRCFARNTVAEKGDVVKILNRSGGVAGYGKIVSKRGSIVEVKVQSGDGRIKSGYSIIVDNDQKGDSAQWAASFSDE